MSAKAKSKAVPRRRVTTNDVIDLRRLLPGTKLPGGEFAGLIYPNGIAQALIVGPEYDGTLAWDAAVRWASELKVHGFTDYTLPTRKEQSLLFANLGDFFKPNWYWSSEQHASHSSHAWGLLFNYGGQNSWLKDSLLRARAVRRLAL